jgi:hypothetical protein
VLCDLNGTDKGVTFSTVGSSKPAKHLSAPFRQTRFTSLSVVFMPTAESITNPLTVELVWHSADRSILAKEILNVPGAERLVIGGTGGTSQIVVDCPLKQFSPFIKDRLSYNDVPCVSISLNPIKSALEHKSAGTTPPILCSVVVRAQIEATSFDNPPANTS